MCTVSATFSFPFDDSSDVLFIGRLAQVRVNPPMPLTLMPLLP